MKIIKVLSALLFAVALASPFAAQADGAKERLVLQVSDNDPAKWNLALNNAENVQEAFGKDNIQVEIVAYGPGLNMLKADSKVAPRLNKALDQSVGLIACGNTMQKMKVTKADLTGGVQVVDGGLVHIMKRQKEGWNYIRP
ncbi:MAG: DsrE family protein [Betaproteobacteria bacterium]|nr:DsrE family protein [Betaproteobacteria bacterium]MDH5221733.1 DsrE family protein [Betaproteobacteria bacterium]MDH5352191.1 DsrE family protein [Betaproteobacteria bacterium]